MALLTLRSTRDSALTWEEGDANLLALDSDSPWKVSADHITYDGKVGVAVDSTYTPVYDLDFGNGDSATVGITNGDLKLHVAGPNEFQVWNNTVQSITVKTTGKVGINDSNPTEMLSVGGNIQVSDTAYANVVYANSIFDGVLSVSGGQINNVHQISTTDTAQIQFGHLYSRASGHKIYGFDSLLTTATDLVPTSYAVKSAFDSFSIQTQERLDSLEDTMIGRLDSLEDVTINRLDSLEDVTINRLDSLELNIIGRLDSLEDVTINRLDSLELTMIGRLDSLEGTIYLKMDSFETDVNNQFNNLSIEIHNQYDSLENHFRVFIDNLDSEIRYNYDSLEAHIKRVYDSLEGEFRYNYDSLENHFKGVYDSLEVHFKTHYDSLEDHFLGHYDSLETHFKTTYNNLDSEFRYNFDSLEANLKHHFDSLEVHFLHHYDSLETHFKDVYNNLDSEFRYNWDSLETHFKNHYDSLEGHYIYLYDSLENYIRGLYDSLETQQIGKFDSLEQSVRDAMAAEGLDQTLQLGDSSNLGMTVGTVTSKTSFDGRVGLIVSGSINGQGAHAGLGFASEVILPLRGATSNNAAIDLGSSSYKFKDGYWSGTLSATAAATTGATNLKWGTADKLRIAAGGVHCEDWIRSDTSGKGWYHTTGGGGWMMQDTTWIRAYGSKGVYVANQVAATGDVTAFYSDERLKEKVGTIDNALDAVESIETFLYKHNEIAKEHGYDDDKVHAGVSAQSVEKVLPEIVDLAPFDYETLEDGTVVSKSGEDYKTVKYDKLTVLLIEAVKELSAKVKELESKK